MREIKFRAWDKGSEIMYEPFSLVSMFGFGINYPQLKEKDESGEWVLHKDITLMQYTGLKDKNGKEIYEGDWIKCEGLVCRVDYVVEPAIAGFVFNQDGCGRYMEYAVEDGKAFNYEVIGNIFEIRVGEETEGSMSANAASENNLRDSLIAEEQNRRNLAMNEEQQRINNEASVRTTCLPRDNASAGPTEEAWALACGAGLLVFFFTLLLGLLWINTWLIHIIQSKCFLPFS